MEVGFIQFFAVLFSLILGSGTGSPPPPAEPMSVIEAPRITQQSSTAEVSGDALAIDNLATCLTDNNAKFYGAYWCSHCDKQKDRFGKSMENIQYIECDDNGPNGNAQSCLDAGITAYPTWKMPGHKDMVGAQTYEQLAEWSGCSYHPQ